MSDHRYVPAPDGWFLLCREDLVLGVDPVIGAARVDELWTHVAGGAMSATLLDELTRGGISSAPAFALAELGTDGWRVLARGGVRIELPESGEAIDGAGAIAWAERGVPAGTGLAVVVAGASAEGASLPTRLGAVRASSFEIGMPARPQVAPAPRRGTAPPPPPPVVAPAPAAETPADPVAVPEEIAVPGEQTLASRTLAAFEPDVVDDPTAASVRDAPAEEGTGYDHLFGATVVRRVEDAAVRAPDEADDAPAPVEERTKVATDLEARRALRRAAKAAASEAAPPTPRLWLELSTGGREEFDATIVVGRAPTASASRATVGGMPRLVTMDTPNQDISRTHAQLALEGGTVVVTDLHSSNGTFVTLPGRSPVKLRGGEPTPVVVGTVVDLGDGATLTVREET